MRTKTRGGRARLCKLPSPTTNTCSLHFPSLSLDEPYGKNDDVNSASTYSDNLVGILGGLGFSEEFMEIDWSEGESCVMCDKSGGNLLVCSEIGCALALHESCMDFEPKFDDVRNFYCPYCWYKREMLRAQKLRKKAMETKRAVMCFIDSKIDGDYKGKVNHGRDKEEELNVSPSRGEENFGDCEDRKDDDQIEDQFLEGEDDLENDGDSAKIADSCDQCKTAVEQQSELSSDDQSLKETPEFKSPVKATNKERFSEENVSESHDFGVLEDGEEIQAEYSGQVDDGGNERMVEDPSQMEPCIASNVQEVNVVGGPHQEEGREMDVSDYVKLKQGRWEDDEKILLETSGAEMSDSDAETTLMHQRRLGRKCKKKVPQNVGSPMKRSSPLNAPPKKIARTRNQKVAASKKHIQRKATTTKFTNQMFCNERRKRLHWTTEEEEMLREGVEKFSTEVNKNLPWTKILQFGHHVFDPARSPVDLKDKWRNIMAKESSTVNRR